MDEEKRRRRMMKKLNYIVSIIREEAAKNGDGTVDFYTVCFRTALAPSTLYNFIPFIERFFDIHYEGREFIVFDMLTESRRHTTTTDDDNDDNDNDDGSSSRSIEEEKGKDAVVATEEDE